MVAAAALIRLPSHLVTLRIPLRFPIYRQEEEEEEEGKKKIMLLLFSRLLLLLPKNIWVAYRVMSALTGGGGGGGGGGGRKQFHWWQRGLGWKSLSLHGGEREKTKQRLNRNETFQKLWGISLVRNGKQEEEEDFNKSSPELFFVFSEIRRRRRRRRRGCLFVCGASGDINDRNANHEKEEKKFLESLQNSIMERRHFRMPNQQRALNKLPTGLRCRNFVSKHRLSIQIGAKRARTYVFFN